MSDDRVPLDKVVKAYLKIRDTRAELKKEYEADDAVLEESQDLLSAHMLNQMNEIGTDLFRTKYGTVFKSETIKPHVTDWDQFYKYVDDTKSFDAFERRIKTTFVSSYMEQNDGDAPPGVAIHRRFTANVRRKN